MNNASLSNNKEDVAQQKQDLEKLVSLLPDIWGKVFIKKLEWAHLKCQQKQCQGQGNDKHSRFARDK